MAIRIHIHENIGSIFMEGRFDFLVHREFKQAYMDMLDNPAIHEIEVDMQRLDFMDSSALGMLLLLRERVHAVSKSIALANPSEIASKLLWVANFDKLFPIRNFNGYHLGGKDMTTMR